MNLHNTNSISNLNNGFIRHRSKLYIRNCNSRMCRLTFLKRLIVLLLKARITFLRTNLLSTHTYVHQILFFLIIFIFKFIKVWCKLFRYPLEFLNIFSL